MLLRNILIRAVWFAETFRRNFQYFSHSAKPLPVALPRNFSKGRVFHKFSRNFLKKSCQYFFSPDYYNAPVLSLGTQEGLPVDNLLLQLTIIVTSIGWGYEHRLTVRFHHVVHVKFSKTSTSFKFSQASTSSSVSTTLDICQHYAKACFQIMF